MSMMANFFDITKDSKEIFKDTAIMNTKYASELNQWPTVFISLSGAGENIFKITKYIKLALRNEYANYFGFTENETKELLELL